MPHIARHVRRIPKEEFRRGYVDAHYPGQVGYAYQADILGFEDGRWVMHQILRDVDWIEDWHEGHPVLHMKDGTTLYAQDSNDFPQPYSGDEESEDREDSPGIDMVWRGERVGPRRADY